MGDLVKIAAKTALIAVITGAIIGVFAVVSFPAIDFTAVYTAVSKALAIVNYWFPVLAHYWRLVLTLYSVALALIALRFSLIAVRWIMKVNE